MATVLILDKDPLHLELVRWLLAQERHEVTTAADPDTAYAYLEAQEFDLVIVDPASPRHDAYRVCQQIRLLREHCLLVVVSERTDEEQIVRMLLGGVDDYMVKPYRPRELLARVHSALRRASIVRHNRALDGTVTVGDISLNLFQMHALVRGKVVALTPRELALLHVLMVNASHVLSRSQLMHHAWGDQFLGGPKTVDVCIQRLRNKLRMKTSASSYIKAVRGFGYSFEKPRTTTVSDRADAMDLKLLPRRRLAGTSTVTRL